MRKKVVFPLDIHQSLVYHGGKQTTCGCLFGCETTWRRSQRYEVPVLEIPRSDHWPGHDAGPGRFCGRQHFFAFGLCSLLRRGAGHPCGMGHGAACRTFRPPPGIGPPESQTASPAGPPLRHWQPRPFAGGFLIKRPASLRLGRKGAGFVFLPASRRNRIFGQGKTAHHLVYIYHDTDFPAFCKPFLCPRPKFVQSTKYRPQILVRVQKQCGGRPYGRPPQRDPIFRDAKVLLFWCDQQQKEYGSIPLCRHIGWVFYPSAQVVSGTCSPLISSPGMVPRGCYK